MRGLAVLAAAGAVLVLATRWTPSIRPSRPDLPAIWVLPGAVLAGAVIGLVAFGFLGVASVAVAFGFLAAATPVAVDVIRRRRREEELAAAWPDFLALVRGRVVAGETLPDAFIAAAGRSREPLRSAARDVSEAVTFGDGFGPAMERLRSELDDPTADRVLSTLDAAHRSGGPRVGLVLATLATSVAVEVRLRRAHFAALTEQRMTALVALIAPWGLLALTIATNPQSAASYRTSTGTLIVAIGLLSTSLGYLAARRAAALSQAPRVFK